MKPVVLILGAGANIGASVARQVADNGYMVAVYSLTVENGTASGGVVVYNAAAFTPFTNPYNIFSVSSEALERDIWGFSSLPQSNKKNIHTQPTGLTNHIVSSLMLTLAIGTSASAYWIGAAGQHYSSRGYRMRYKADGEAHATFSHQLAERQHGSVPWHATFMKDKGDDSTISSYIQRMY
ncbi:hypothetical protein V8C42DRAFT_353808 [Trichoderma barbatum]